MKEEMTTALVLDYPNSSKVYILDTDASNLGVAALLSQIQEDEERVIADHS